MEEQAATANKPGGQIAYRFHARDLNLVAGPATPGTAVRFQVLLDGQPPARRTGPTLTARARAPSPNSGFTSSSANLDRSPSAPSRSRSSTPAARPTPSPSVRSGRAASPEQVTPEWPEIRPEGYHRGAFCRVLPCSFPASYALEQGNGTAPAGKAGQGNSLGVVVSGGCRRWHLRC